MIESVKCPKTINVGCNLQADQNYSPKDWGSDDPLDLELDVTALAIDRPGSSMSEAFEETELMPVLGEY